MRAALCIVALVLSAQAGCFMGHTAGLFATKVSFQRSFDALMESDAVTACLERSMLPVTRELRNVVDCKDFKIPHRIESR